MEERDHIIVMVVIAYVRKNQIKAEETKVKK